MRLANCHLKMFGMMTFRTARFLLIDWVLNLNIFAYPYGDKTSAGTREFNIIKELGYDTATTTRKGVLFPEHAQHLQALPRISLNGDYQKNRYIRLFLSGAPFAFLNRFRHIDVN
ncbi:MAG: hypothetical protein KAR12_03220 [Methylococcales bacterium]|nr:hypothetical protein [Methylococcales bacterium]